MNRLAAADLSLAYHGRSVVHELSVAIPDGQITSIIGPNGCGKSTLLRALARLKRPASGAVLLDGQLIHQLPTRDVARRLGLLQQQTTPPEGITVEDLVRRGRYPHQSFFQPPSASDAAAVERALTLTRMIALRHRPVDQLSGGQRQRAWLAMTLAQETPLLLLDEPTTYLDLAHQVGILDLIRQLNVQEGRTIVMVLHDINEAARMSHHLIAMRDGRVEREGTPADVIEPSLLRTLYGIESTLLVDPLTGGPYVVAGGSVPAAPAAPGTGEPCIEVRHLDAGYGRAVVVPDCSLTLPAGAVTAIVGPNGCGKSTLLRTIGRLLRPLGGAVLLDGRDVQRGSRRSLARRLALLGQGPVAPDGLLVEDLVAAGRFPHQTLFHQWSEADEGAVTAALRRCGVVDFQHRSLETLSGGQRQHVWMAMTLAQDAPVLLLDEPTSFLDIAHQVELLELVRTLRDEGRTIVMVLHDVNLAARYADLLIAMKDGRVVASGAPAALLTEDLVRAVFDVDARVVIEPRLGGPLVLPVSARAAGAVSAVLD